MEHCIATAPRASHSSAHCWEVPSVSPCLTSRQEHLFPGLTKNCSWVDHPHGGESESCAWGAVSKYATPMAKMTQECKCRWVGWQVTMILVIGWKRQEGWQFKANLSCTVSLKPFWITWDDFPETKKKKKHKCFLCELRSEVQRPTLLVSKLQQVTFFLENSDFFL